MDKGLKTLEEIKYKLSELEFVLEHNHREKAPYIQENKWNAIEKELKAFGVLKKLFKSSFTYKYKLENSFDCGQLTQEEYELLKEVLS